jgi:Na+/H+ antiporter NhaA
MKADTYNQDMSRRTVLPAWLVRPIEAFTRTEALGGGLLALAAVVALLWANSAWQESYRQIWATPVAEGVFLGLFLGNQLGDSL